MIYTITFNPALDKTVEIDNFSVGNVNRILSVKLDAGGKGINVSKVIKALGGDSMALGVLAGKAGSFIQEQLVKAGIKNKFVFIPGETRTNLKVVDKKQKTNTDINEIGPDISEEDLEEVWKNLSRNLTKEDMVVFSGSVPANVSKGIYGEWIGRVKKIGARTILDADGDLLKLGIEEGPYLVKPNINELERLLNKRIEGVKEAASQGRSLLDFGIKVVALSMGGDGAIFINEEKTILAHGIKVDVESTVGAGDSMVAALAYSIEKGFDFESAVKLAVASGTANVTTLGTEPADFDTVMSYEKQITFEYLNLK